MSSRTFQTWGREEGRGEERKKTNSPPIKKYALMVPSLVISLVRQSAQCTLRCAFQLNFFPSLCAKGLNQSSVLPTSEEAPTSDLGLGDENAFNSPGMSEEEEEEQVTDGDMSMVEDTYDNNSCEEEDEELGGPPPGFSQTEVVFRQQPSANMSFSDYTFYDDTFEKYPSAMIDSVNAEVSLHLADGEGNESFTIEILPNSTTDDASGSMVDGSYISATSVS